MPRRSNEFQRFVRDLETLLAPRGATVRESVLLEDMDSGEPREVDVVVELPSGPRSIRVGIEVCDRARPADSPWVEGIAKKHERLPIDRTVVVSRRGFSKSAKKKAAACKVEVVTFAEAISDDHWSEVVLQPPFIHVRSEVSWIASFVVLVANAEDYAKLEGQDLRNMEVVFGEHESPINLTSYIDRVVRGPEAQEKLAQMFKGAQTSEGRLRVRRRGYLRPEGSDTSITPVDGFLITVQRQLDMVDAPLTKGEYGDYAVALATGNVGANAYKLLFRQREGEPAVIHGRFSTPRPRRRES